MHPLVKVLTSPMRRSSPQDDDLIDDEDEVVSTLSFFKHVTIINSNKLNVMVTWGLSTPTVKVLELATAQYGMIPSDLNRITN